MLLELAEPSVRAGVWDHSSFRKDPMMRLKRTGFAAMMTVYGPRSAAEDMIARVRQMHARVEGTTEDGTAYHANDPRLLDWVQATATFGFVEAYSRFVAPLSQAEKSAAFLEGVPAAELYGAIAVPRSWREWESLLDRTAPMLEGSPVLDEFLTIMATARILPPPLRWLQRMLVRAAVEVTPDRVRSLPQLQGKGLRRGEMSLLRLLARLAGRAPMGDLPPAQAERRLAGT